MYIQEIIIDGFKSYAQKTVISGFDPQFNAITGLNGTGKSNILDAICFVLGISNLSQVRVGNLQELIYKQGQAGVTKASVTIIFNNSNPSQSPVGYENQKQISITRQILLGGKNKYLINGHIVQYNFLLNFFHSISLNINNPHFLIMQGRITKILNMKPLEILGLLEETSGTKIFENKKNSSIKIIKKKEIKMEEISKCLTQEIIPILENLKNEKNFFLLWQKNSKEIEKNEKIFLILDYKDKKKKIVLLNDELKKLNEKKDSLENNYDELNEEIKENEKKIKEITENFLNSSSSLKKLKDSESSISKNIIKVNTQYLNITELIQTENTTIKNINQSISSIKKTINEKNNLLIKNNEEILLNEEKISEKEKQLNEKKSNFDKINSGVFNGDENIDTRLLTEFLSEEKQILAWEKIERENNLNIKKFNKKKLFLSNLLNEKKSKKNSSHIDEKDKQNLKKLTQEVEVIQKKMKKIEDDILDSDEMDVEGEENNKTIFSESDRLKGLLQKYIIEMRQLEDSSKKLDALLHSRLYLDYDANAVSRQDPSFTPDKIHGFAANLFSIRDELYAMALEVIGGGKLYQLVVSDEQTGKKLLQHGKLKKRMTLLPLNKINSHVISNEKLNRIRKLAQDMNGEADLALNFIKFDEKYRKIMEYIYGNVIICNSIDIAKKISFDKSIAIKTVTINGDVYDPSGTLTGGSKGSIGNLLSNITNKKSLVSKIENINLNIVDYKKQLNIYEEKIRNYEVVKNEYDMKKINLDNLNEKFADSDEHQLDVEIENLEKEIEELSNQEVQSQKLIDQAVDELKRLRSSVATKESDKNAAKSKKNDFEAELKSDQAVINQMKANLTKLKNLKTQLTQENHVNNQEISSLEEQLDISKKTLDNLTIESQDLTSALKDLNSSYEEITALIKNETAQSNEIEKEINQLKKVISNNQKTIQNNSVEAKKVTLKVQQKETELKQVSNSLDLLKKNNQWIEKEEEFFGLENTEYYVDESEGNLNERRKKLNELKQEQEKLSKKINKKVISLIEQAENDYQDLKKKKEILLQDKLKIEKVIEELDIQKATALYKTWRQVNKDFGSIFSMLLPGTTAKLEPVIPDENTEGGNSQPFIGPEPTDDANKIKNFNLTHGLEVKVAFNNVWKESLTELSGGQRSLLALSLILALLLFKPAPMYILDEVDAALDLSHTQNIGMMIRSHFSNSQFIIVSLKEGMFNNANVIFRTRFVDGISAVTRTVAGARANKLLANSTNKEDDDENNIDGPPNKRKLKK